MIWNPERQKSLRGTNHYPLKLFFLRRFFFSLKRKSGNTYIIYNNNSAICTALVAAPLRI